VCVLGGGYGDGWMSWCVRVNLCVCVCQRECVGECAHVYVCVSLSASLCVYLFLSAYVCVSAFARDRYKIIGLFCRILSLF